MNTEKRLDFGPVVGVRVGGSLIGKPLMTVIFYYADGLLIDTGAYRTRKSVEKFCREVRVDQIALTHYHEDHAGNAGFLKKMLDVPVYGHPLTVAALKNNVRLRPYEHFIFGRLECADITPLPEVIETERYQFHPVHTPGHSKDHVIYHEKNEGWVFSGDLFLGSNIKFFRRDEDIVETIASLKRLLSLDFGRLFCGHNPKLDKPQIFVQKKLDQLISVVDNVEDLVKSGMPNKAIVRQLTKGKESHVSRWVTLGDVSYKNLVICALSAIDE